jgi:hypothetical protein
MRGLTPLLPLSTPWFDQYGRLCAALRRPVSAPHAPQVRPRGTRGPVVRPPAPPPPPPFVLIVHAASLPPY